jgi:hypothetical protein
VCFSNLPQDTTTATSKSFSQASWGRLDMKPNRKKGNINKENSNGFHIHRNGWFFYVGLPSLSNLPEEDADKFRDSDVPY